MRKFQISFFLRVLLPIKNQKGPLSAEQLFHAFHGIIKHNKKSIVHFSLEIFANQGGIFFIVACPKRYRNFIENQIYAQYPDAQIKEVNDYTSENKADKFTSCELTLAREFYLPIKTFTNFQVDPLASITGVLGKLKDTSEVWIQTVIRPINNIWQQEGKNYIQYVKNRTGSDGKKVQMQSGESLELSEIEKKNNKVGFQFAIRIIVKSENTNKSKLILDEINASFRQFQTAQLNSLTVKIKKFDLLKLIKKIILGRTKGDKLSIIQKFRARFLDEKEKGIINIEELASIYHLPYESVKTPNIAWAVSKKSEFPPNLPLTDCRYFAYTDFHNEHKKFGIKKADRRRHVYLLGKTGSGKSTLLKNMIIGDIMDGNGVGVIDPHGDLVEDILTYIPQERMKDVIYFDPADTEYPIGLNMLETQEGESMELLTDGIISVFKKYFGDSWGPRLQYLLSNTVMTLLHCQNVSLLAVQRILTDKNYRSFLLKQVKDPFLLKFWQQEFSQFESNARTLSEVLSPIQNKVGRFLNSPMVRNMFGQIKSSINLSDIMNSKKIFLVNLSQGKIGEENSSLLGGMLVTRIYLNAMQRVRIPEEERNDFYLYVDEFQNFATDTFIKILSEARKYRLNLTITHQYIDQLTPEIQTAIFGNVGTLMNFVVGQADAAKLQKEYFPDLEADDLINLEKFKLALKLMIDGSQSKAFTSISLKPQYNQINLKNEIKESSRTLYSKPRSVVEQKINKWVMQDYDSNGNLSSLLNKQKNKL